MRDRSQRCEHDRLKRCCVKCNPNLACEHQKNRRGCVLSHPLLLRCGVVMGYRSVTVASAPLVSKRFLKGRIVGTAILILTNVNEHEQTADCSKCGPHVRIWAKSRGWRCTAGKRAWDRLHPDNARARRHKRKARIRGNGGSFTAKQWRALKASYGNSCVSCWKTEAKLKKLGRQLVPDHIVLTCPPEISPSKM